MSNQARSPHRTVEPAERPSRPAGAASRPAGAANPVKRGDGAGPGRGAPGQRRVARAVREREMTAVAGRMFGRRRFEDVSMDEIAEAAGVTKPMLYAYFGSKEGLFGAAAAQAEEQLRGQLMEVAGERQLAPEQRLWRGLLAAFTFIEDHRDAWTVLYPGDAPPGGPVAEAAVRGRQAMAELLSELLAEAARREGVSEDAASHTAPLAHALTAATIGAAHWWLAHPGEPKELQALRVMNLAWMGFGNLLEGRFWLPAD